MYRRNQYLWSSLIKQSITDTATSELCNIGIIILIVYYPLKLLLSFRVLLVYRFDWFYFEKDCSKFLAKILVWSMCVLEGINFRFSENLACFVFLQYPIWDLLIYLITDDITSQLILFQKLLFFSAIFKWYR